MDKQDFLKRLFSMYPMNFNENNFGYWAQAYETVLKGNHIDYDKLFFIMITEYDRTNAAPSPKWIKDNLRDCRIKGKSEILQHIENLRHEPHEPIPEHIKMRFSALKKQLSMDLV